MPRLFRNSDQIRNNSRKNSLAAERFTDGEPLRKTLICNAAQAVAELLGIHHFSGYLCRLDNGKSRSHQRAECRCELLDGYFAIQTAHHGHMANAPGKQSSSDIASAK